MIFDECCNLVIASHCAWSRGLLEQLSRGQLGQADEPRAALSDQVREACARELGPKVRIMYENATLYEAHYAT